MIYEAIYKMLFEAGFKSGMQALRDGSTDLPISYFYESFVEQFGLPKEKWQGLTDDEIVDIDVDVIERLVCDHQLEFARAIEAKLQEKNT